MSELPAPRKTSRWRRWTLEIAIFAAVFIGFQMWQLRDTTRGMAPEFSGQRLDGSHFDLASWRAEQSGQAVLLYFWADWCPICKTTAGSVSSLSEDWPVTSIASQSGEAPAIAQWMAERDYRWPTLADSSGKIMQQYGLPGVPGFVIIAPDGNIRFVSVGYTSEIGLRLRLWWASRT
jgi:peroxiredoxin